MRPELQEALRVTHAVAQERRLYRRRLRSALKSGDTQQVVDCARALMGLDDAEIDQENESFGAPARLERGAGRA